MFDSDERRTAYWVMMESIQEAARKYAAVAIAEGADHPNPFTLDSVKDLWWEAYSGEFEKLRSTKIES